MVYHLKIECIGDGGGLSGKTGALAVMFFGNPPARAWVARVKGMRDKWVDREFVQGQKDYTKANSVGSRGVELHFFLTDGLYEISSPVSWAKTDRYFAYIEDGELWRVTREQAQEWVNDHLE